MKKYSLEFSVGVFVLVGLICLSYMTVKLGKMELFSNDGYTLTADFASITGLRTGASVEIAGVPVGKVTSISLTERFYAKVAIQLNKGVSISDDSTASIKTSGLIGDKYIRLSPGGSTIMLSNGERIDETEPAIDIENLISKYVFGGVK